MTSTRAATDGQQMRGDRRSPAPPPYCGERRGRNDSRARRRRASRGGYDAAVDGTQPAPGGTGLEKVRARVDAVLSDFLADRRAALAEADPRAASLAVELGRVIDAGGKRLRPLFCYWGFRAGDGTDGEEILRAAASLELLHTFAIIHDDVMDRSTLRR